MKKIKFYCVTNKEVNFITKDNHYMSWVGKNKPPENYIKCNEKKNIFYKENYYSELTFHYWYWKNLLPQEKKDQWVGFCQKRRYWVNYDNINEISKKNDDNKVSHRNIINESIYQKFLFSGEDAEKKIKIIFQNSLDFNNDKYVGKMDLIFIDGGHTYSVVKSDSEKSFEMLSKNGIILWHDYVPGKESARDVVRYIHEISKSRELFNIKGTTLVYYKNG